MRKLLLALLVLPGIALAGEAPSVQRQHELLYLLRQDCGSCHGLTLRGSLGPALLPKALEGKDATTLAKIILDGVPGTPMPPWRFEIRPDEALWLARTLKRGVKP